jgi:hypothetical protein
LFPFASKLLLVATRLLASAGHAFNRDSLP